MKKKTILEIVLGLAIIGLAIWLYMSIMEPVKFENEYNKRRDASAEKLKAIRTLEESYKVTYGCYCGSFDTLFNRLMNEDSLRIITKVINYDKIPEDVNINDDMTEAEAIKKGYISLQEIFVNPIAQLREQGKLTMKDADGRDVELNDEAILNLRYVPYPKGAKNEFQLEAGGIEKSGFIVPVFECKVDLKALLSDMDQQLVINKIAELENINRYAGWKVGDMTQSITDGNFE